MTSHVSIFVILWLVVIPLAAAETHGRELTEIVDEIVHIVGTDQLQTISPDTLPPALLEELGDAVMGVLLNDDWHHERMDAMLGGEGSAQLTLYHQNLGAQYLQANGDLTSTGFLGGGSWMGPGMGMWQTRFTPSGTRWSGWDGWSWQEAGGLDRLAVVGFVLTVLVLIVVIVILVRRRDASDHPSLTILKARFARGELSIHEYQHMKKVLKG